jgi:hypothetical protein
MERIDTQETGEERMKRLIMLFNSNPKKPKDISLKMKIMDRLDREFQGVDLDRYVIGEGDRVITQRDLYNMCLALAGFITMNEFRMRWGRNFMSAKKVG